MNSPDVVTFYNVATAPLSNLFPAPVEDDGVTYPTVEHWWLASQFPAARGPIAACPTERLGALPATLGTAEPPQGWTREGSLAAGLTLKFAQHPALAAELRATGTKLLVLVDADRWGGMSAAGGIPPGKNRVGLALMQVRASL